MTFRVLSADSKSDRMAWLELWDMWPGREIQAHPAYVELFAQPDVGQKVYAAVWADSKGSILYPFVLRQLASEPWALSGEDRCDLTTPYGYGGPYAWGGGSGRSQAFWQELELWLGERK